jgi:plasmid replication initiation protein
MSTSISNSFTLFDDDSALVGDVILNEENNAISRMTMTESNYLVCAGYELTLNESRLLMLVQAKINPLEWDRDWRFRITAKEWSEAFERQLKHCYGDIENSIDKILEREIVFTTGPDVSAAGASDAPHRAKKRERGRWVSWATYMPSEGAVEVEIPRTLRKYLAGDLLRSDGYTSVKLLSAGKLNSPYSFRIFKWIMQYKDKGLLLVTVDDLRRRLKLEEKYTKYADLRKWVLDRAVQEINNKTNYVVSFEPMKKSGRRILSLSFTFSEKRQREFKL